MEGNRERFGSSKRDYTHPTALSSPYSPPSSPAANVKFRILCLRYHVKSVIGVRGGTIQQIRQCTKSKIWVEDAPSDSIDNVISIIAEVGATSRVKLGEEEEEVEISKAQDALIRIFEVLKDETRTDTVSCWLLIEASHVGVVKGEEEDGESMESIRKQTGCSNIEIHTENLPVCADPDDVMVEIEGNVLAVKKALVSISSRLQACQIYKTRMAQNKSVNNTIQEALPRPVEVNSHDCRPRTSDTVIHRQTEVFPRCALDRHTEAVPRDALRRTMDVVPQEALYGSSDVFQGDVSRQHREVDPLDFMGYDDFWDMGLVLKILCPSETVGGFMGPRGIHIMYFQNKTGASIHVGDTPPDCDECLITVTSKIPTVRKSPAERAILLIFSRILDISAKNVLENGSRSSIRARLVVPTNHIGWLLAEGYIVSDLRRIGASIQVCDVEQNPKCISANDQVLEISGELPYVQEAIYNVTARLRANLISHSATISVITKSNFMPRRISSGETTNPGSMGFLTPSSHPHTMSTSMHRKFQNPLQIGSHNPVHHSTLVDADPYMKPEDLFLGRPNPAAGYSCNLGQLPTMDDHVVRNRLREVLSQLPASPGCLSFISENVVNFLRREEDGYSQNRLQKMRQISGAEVILQEHRPLTGKKDWIISISGTYDQINRALKILDALIRICENRH